MEQLWKIVSKDKQGNELVIMNVTTKQKADEELKRCKQLLSSDNQYRIVGPSFLVSLESATHAR